MAKPLQDLILLTLSRLIGEARIDFYCYLAAGQFGSLATALAGLDTIVFTAGIGENSVQTRRRICERLYWAGLELDEGKNTANASRISTDNSAINVLVIPTDEEIVIARHVRSLTGT